MPSTPASVCITKARITNEQCGRRTLRHYPWILDTSKSREVERLAQARSGLDSLLPERRAGLDTAALQAGLEPGARVGLKRNLEFTAGGRAHRISTRRYTKQ